MSKIESAAGFMTGIAQDDSHGYDQSDRWGAYGDYDCSGLVISAYQQAGVPVKDAGATYTGNMHKVFTSQGFVDVTKTINLATGAGLQRGDVLLNHVHHTAMYLGGNQEVEASINEKGTALGGRKGDQTGKEILIRSYRNYPWNAVLRYVDKSSASTPSVPYDIKPVNIKLITTTVLTRRTTANTSPQTKIEEIAKNTVFTATRMITNGEIINGNAVWYEVENYGWVSAYYTKPYTTVGTPSPAREILVVDGALGVRTKKEWQRVLGVAVDGDFGINSVKALQRHLNARINASLNVDGDMGTLTKKALQRYLGVSQDGVLGTISIKALQTKLNNGAF